MLVDRLVVVELRRVATAGDVVRSDELCSDLARGVAVSSKTVGGRSVASPGSGLVGTPTSGWLPLRVGETNPSNPGRAMCVVSVKAIAAPRMTEIVTTTRPSHSRNSRPPPGVVGEHGLGHRHGSTVPRNCPRPPTGRRSC